MYLNTIAPGNGAKKAPKRVGRGPGSGIGKTCGRGTKGQHARTSVGAGFEGGQMPIHRRIPKSGFKSWKALCTMEVRLSELNKLPGDIANLDTLKDANIITNKTRFVKIYLSGELTKVCHVQGLTVSKGAREKIEALGGKVED